MKIKLISQFKKIEDFGEIKEKKRCWNKCHLCQELWNSIKTVYVHMIQYKDPKEFINGNGSFFICDNCKSKIQTDV